MVLSDRTIREELEAGRIVIDPLGEDCIQPSSVDLHVDQYFRLFRNHSQRVIDVREDQEDLTELVDVGTEDPLILHPDEFVLGSTVERVALPDASLLTCYLLRKATGLASGLVVHADRALDNLTNGSFGLVFSQSVLLALVSAGLTRDEAYRIVQRDARTAWAERRHFRQILKADPDVTLTDAQLDEAFDLTRTLRHVDRFADAVTALP